MNSVAAFFVVTVALVPCVLGAPQSARGGRVSWARLITSSGQSWVHSEQDPKLASFIGSQTSLNIDPDWQYVRAGDLDKLCAFPFLYVKDLTDISGDEDLRNLREYLQRGGFICVDPCFAGSITKDEDSKAFILRHQAWFTKLVPGSTLRELPDTHEIYRCYFNVKVDDLFPRAMLNQGAQKPPRIGLQGVFLGDRMIAVVGASGLECGWPQTPQRTPGCMKMIVNMYVYAMTRSAVQPSQSP